VQPEPPLDLESTRAEAPRAKSQRPPPPPPWAGRNDAIDRLRARAQAMAPAASKAILDEGRRRRSASGSQ
jgi:hypothetical protein